MVVASALVARGSGVREGSLVTAGDELPFGDTTRSVTRSACRSLHSPVSDNYHLGNTANVGSEEKARQEDDDQEDQRIVAA